MPSTASTSKTTHAARDQFGGDARRVAHTFYISHIIEKATTIPRDCGSLRQADARLIRQAGRDYRSGVLSANEELSFSLDRIARRFSASARADGFLTARSRIRHAGF